MSGHGPCERAPGVTPAHSHPELTQGEFAAPPPRFSRPASPRGIARRAATIGAAFAVLAGFGGMMALLPADPRPEVAPVARMIHEPPPAACAEADAKALDALVALIHSGADADLRQAGDAIFRLRRARRNCRAGWIAVAQADYDAIGRLLRASVSAFPPR